jgi:ABC-type transport system involved in multi-copper enzyme maturation permease subunit
MGRTWFKLAGLTRFARLLSTEARKAALVFLVALVAGLFGAPPMLVLAIALVGVLLAAWAVRRRGAELAGPMFFYDVVRLARRGRSTLLRCTYALLLLVGLYCIYWERFPVAAEFRDLFHVQPSMKLEELARFGGTFATSIFALQSAAVVLLTPAYVSGAIAEEKERRTLELLFTTHLTDREIVLGKLFGRLMHLLGVALVGLPILMTLQVWGGVEPLLPIVGFIVTLLTLLSIGGVCIRCSVAFRDSFTALVVSYMIILPVVLVGVLTPGCFFSSPVAFMMSVEMYLGAGNFHQLFWSVTQYDTGDVTLGTLTIIALLLAYAVPHALIAFFCIITAVRSLRGPASEPTPHLKSWLRDRDPVRNKTKEQPARPFGSPILTGGWDPLPEPPEERRPLLLPIPDRLRIPVTDAPLFWKEVYHRAHEWTFLSFWKVFLPSVGVLAVFLLLVFTLVTILDLRTRTEAEFGQILREIAARIVNPAIRVLGMILAGAWCAGAAWRTASCITREREGRTLGALLTLPLERSEILRAKWCGGLLRLRWLGYVLAALWCAGVFCGALHPVAALLLAAAVAVHLSFLTVLAVNLSLASRNTFWANFNMTLMLLLTFAGAWVGMAYYEVFFGGSYTAPGSWWEHFYQVGLNPLWTWWYLGFNWEEFQQEAFGPEGGWHGPLGATLAGVGAFAALTGVLWLEAQRTFNKLGA